MTPFSQYFFITYIWLKCVENPGEELVGSYLKEVLNCEFVEFNLNTKFTQGEIDVVGINYDKKIVYICEVATHLETGLQYVGKNNQPDNVERFIKKFEKNIEYANRNFSDWKKVFMLWSPIVKKTKEGSKHDQMRDVEDIKKTIKEKFDQDIQIVVNSEYLKCIDELRKVAKARTDEIKSPLMRFMQIEEKLRAYLEKSKQ